MAKYRSIPVEEKVRIIRSLLEEKKAQDIVILDVREICNFTDFFVICSGESLRQIKTISEHLEDNLKKAGIRIFKNTRTGGDDNWVVLDCLDVVVHIFEPEARVFYNLERLWRTVEKREEHERKDS